MIIAEGESDARAGQPPASHRLPRPVHVAAGTLRKEATDSKLSPRRNAAPVGHGKGVRPVEPDPGARNPGGKPKGRQREGRRKGVVAIDAGHGGKDTGAVGPNGHQEKDIVLSIARQLHGMLRAERDLKPVMVRRDDRFIPLRERLAAARAAAADLFVSLHADADPSGQVRGMSVYTLSERGAGREAARALARWESGRAASAILHEVQKFFPIHSQQVQKARFMVLKSPDFPSVLIETGFITHPDGERDLTDPSRQKKIARTLFYGIRRFLTGSFRLKNGG